MRKIAFIFPSNFTVLTPFLRPVGGSESAVSYLCVELAKLGCDVTLFTFANEQEIVAENILGVRNLNFNIQGQQINFNKAIQENDYEVFIIKNGLVELAQLLKNTHPNAKVIFWTGHAHDQQALQALHIPELVQYLDAIWCVSNWQKHKFMQHFKLPEQKIKILRNAISPFFENLYLELPEIKRAKQSLDLVYTSTPFRGLKLLLDIFPAIYKKYNNAALKIFSSMQVYGIEADQYKDLYALLAAMPNTAYYGSITQAQLAAALRKARILIYPNIFPETSCIAVMEAMAAGLLVVTSDLGALPETTDNMAKLVQHSENFVAQFTQVVLECIDELKDDLDFIRIQKQILYINQFCTWRSRARECLNLLTSL